MAEWCEKLLSNCFSVFPLDDWRHYPWSILHPGMMWNNAVCNKQMMQQKENLKIHFSFLLDNIYNINAVCSSTSWKKRKGCFWRASMTENFGFVQSDSHFLNDLGKATYCNGFRNRCYILRLSFYLSPEYLTLLHVLLTAKANVWTDFMESLDLDSFRASELFDVTYIWHDFLTRSRTFPQYLGFYRKPLQTARILKAQFETS